MEGHCIWREVQRVFHVSRHAVRVQICRPSRRYGQNGVLQPYDLPVTRGRGAERVGVRCAIEWRQANADYVRTTKDVDVCMRRVDLERAAIALKPHGFELTEVKGIPMFFDGSDATPKQAVHIVLAEDPVPDIGEGVRDETFHWKRVELDRLLTMKMIANRAHDHVHVMNLYRSGAIDRTCIDRVPAHPRMHLKDVLDRCDREYGNSPH